MDILDIIYTLDFRYNGMPNTGVANFFFNLSGFHEFCVRYILIMTDDPDVILF